MPAWRETAFHEQVALGKRVGWGLAIAITLLVLGLAVPLLPPHAPEGALITRLVALWPNFIAYCLSFAVIGIM